MLLLMARMLPCFAESLRCDSILDVLQVEVVGISVDLIVCCSCCTACWLSASSCSSGVFPAHQDLDHVRSKSCWYVMW